MTVPIAAPDTEYFGISIIFKTKSTTAPAMTEANTLLSFPIGTRICIPMILVSPINNNVGSIICIGSMALSYSFPDSSSILGSANNVKYTSIGIDENKTNWIAFTDRSSNLFCSFFSKYTVTRGNNTAPNDVTIPTNIFLIFTAAL